MNFAKSLVLCFFSFLAFANMGMAQSSTSNENTMVAERYIEAVYESASADEANMYYLFRRTDGRSFGFAIPKFSEASNTAPEMPEAMLDKGQAAANPGMVGKTFRLIFAEGGDRVVKVRLVE